MNAVEIMQGELAALSRRVVQLEELLRGRGDMSKDEFEAQRVAESLGFDVDVIMVPRHVKERRQLAEELKKKGWSASRIARAMYCCDRTAQRWAERKPSRE